MHRARRTTTTSADHRSSNRIATGVIALTALIWATLGISISAPARASSPAGASSSADASSSIGASSSADANSSADADPPGTAAITDPALVAEVVAAARRHTEGASRTSVAVDVVGKQAGQAASAVIAIGGMVTGSVPGALVQATVPFDRVADLARIDGVEFVRASRPANQRPRRSESVGYGPSVNDGVAAMNATAWQDAGFRGGGTRIGIIDFFTVDSWNTTEQGPRPTLANGHMFCRDSLQTGLCNADGSINSAQGDQHGLAVTEIVKDTAPDADVYIASVNTVSDMRAAVDWFAANGVSIVTRSLGSAYDGPGDGTGPLDSVVDYAASLGITWFNSAGNDAGTGYMRVVVPSN
ncbi:MAG: hypothetical protein ABIQ39_09605, partial [Ilumatobacteraceae bacterium]